MDPLVLVVVPIVIGSVLVLLVPVCHWIDRSGLPDVFGLLNESEKNARNVAYYRDGDE